MKDLLGLDLKRKSQHVNITDEDKEVIVDFIKEHEEFYKKQHEKFKVHHLKDQLW